MDKSSVVGFKTQRKRLLESYAEAQQAITARTIPYHSTGVFAFEVVNFAGASPGVAYAVARKGQSVTLFQYGVGDQVFLGGTTNTRATEADTNLGKASSTNGAEDFVIEGIGFHARSKRVQYAAGTGNLYNGTGVPTDLDVLASLVGDAPMYDPAAINMPPQAQSPFNLEDGFLQALIGNVSVDLLFDRKRTEKIGTVDTMPCASAKSYLRANGNPDQNNTYKIPEGYLWRRDGQPDSEFSVTLTVQRPIVIPINGILPYVTGASSPAAPTRIWVEVVMRLYGLAIDLPSAN
jgi:hypothetical protein